MSYLNDFEIKLKADGKSDYTIRAYLTDIKGMLLEVNKPEEQITYNDIVKYKYYLTNTLHMANSTVNRKLIAANRYFNYLSKSKIVKENPVDGVEHVQNIQRRVKTYIPMDEAKKLLECGKNPRDKAIIAVYLTTGLRVHELVNLTLEDYYKASTDIKTKRQVVRHIVFNNDCRKYVDEYLKIRKPSKYQNLFISNGGEVLAPCNVNLMLKNVAKRAGLPNDISNHSLRHTFCSYVCDTYGVAMAKQVVGHKSIATTQRYCHNTKDQIENVISSVNL